MSFHFLLKYWERCVGVWDTVGSVDSTLDALAIKDTSLPAKVEIALHALAFHENREKFLPTLWTTPQSKLAPNQTLKQVDALMCSNS